MTNSPELPGIEHASCRHLDVVCVVKTNRSGSIGGPDSDYLPKLLLGHIAHVAYRSDGKCYLGRRHLVMQPTLAVPADRWTIDQLPEWAVVHICDPRLVRAVAQADRRLSLAEAIDRHYREW